MKNFVEKTILDIQSVFDDLFYTEITARRKGLLQLLDPRVKMLSVLGMLIVIGLMKTIPALAIMISYVLFLAICSKVPFIRYLRRVVLLSVVFSGIVVLPSLFNIVKPGEPLWHISNHIYITKPGFDGACLLILRSFGSLSLVYLLTATTKWSQLLKSLRVLKIPASFMAILEMTHRYIFLGLELASNLFIAQKSRSFGKKAGKEDRRFVAATMGHLLIRTMVLGDEVYQAMLSRGYTGEVKTITRFQMRVTDYLWLTFHFGLLLISIKFL